MGHCPDFFLFTVTLEFANIMAATNAMSFDAALHDVEARFIYCLPESELSTVRMFGNNL